MDYTFVETTGFTRRITKLGLEGDLRRLQEDLLENPHKQLRAVLQQMVDEEAGTVDAPRRTFYSRRW